MLRLTVALALYKASHEALDLTLATLTYPLSGELFGRHQHNKIGNKVAPKNSIRTNDE